jgi:NADPH-dependent 2,4-dienoyl-CoA reductase/sulfur reductase-like enzyme
MRTVDVVVEGAGRAAIATAIDAARRGLRVLLVIRSRRSGIVQQLRHSLRSAALPPRPHVTVLTGAEVACVDGVNGIEAVVVRDLRTGRLSAFNTKQVWRDVNAAD